MCRRYSSDQLLEFSKDSKLSYRKGAKLDVKRNKTSNGIIEGGRYRSLTKIVADGLCDTTQNTEQKGSGADCGIGDSHFVGTEARRQTKTRAKDIIDESHHLTDDFCRGVVRACLLSQTWVIDRQEVFIEVRKSS